MNNLALMVDAETLALTPDALVTQIGFGLMDLDTGLYRVEPQSLNLKTDSASQPNRRIDPGTVAWWMRQDQAVSATVFDQSAAVQPSQVEAVLKDLITRHDPDVWAAPSTFDLPLLTSLFGKQLWSHRRGFCLKTLAAALDPHDALVPPPNARAHDAAADVDWQMQYLLALYRKLNP